MRLKFFICFLFLLGCISSYSQDYEYKERKKKRMHYIPRYPIELGFHIGTSQFLGDLGGTEAIGQSFIIDTDLPSIRPAVGFFGRYNMGGHFSFRLEMSYLNLSGNDKFAGKGFSATTHSDKDGWFRFYRNLHFQTHVFELTNSCQFIPYNFKLTGSRYTKTKQNTLSPYIVLGAGFLVFNPQAEYNGDWVDLRPLSTEGQGLVEGRPTYSLVQFIIPVGFGVQWEHNHDWILSLEINHRFTFTDYIDDVSTDYVDPAVFEKNFNAETAQLATSLARRSVEHDPNNIYGYITAPNAQRGDPKDNDAYYTINIRLAFYLKKSRFLALVKDY
ncbi:DUF6089 family protein [Aureispira sp. CCB-QB1]|uniref:DUF6089 family protein n=1 Tax=Aureispira sp. CCB-QB1 TaxID=1313421 RepID=UPI0012DC0C7E|nr:DUF6089 family protein [Aureispira sp. CCB-QB1]